MSRAWPLLAALAASSVSTGAAIASAEPSTQPLAGQPLAGQPLAGHALAGHALAGHALAGQALAGQGGRTDGAEATFIGFRQLGPGRTLIYVELSRPVEGTLVKKGRTLEYTLPQTRVTLRNNRRPLLARHFDSPVHSAQLVPAGKALKLVIELREDAQPVSRLVPRGQGATFEVELTRAGQGSSR